VRLDSFILLEPFRVNCLILDGFMRKFVLAVRRRLAIRSRIKMFILGTMQDNYLDWRHGRGRMSDILETRFREQGAVRTESVHYDVLVRAFRHVPITADDVLVDAGCGHGRVISWWLARGHKNRMVGIELDPKIAAAPSQRFADVPNVTIITGNVLEHLPPETTLIWMFNPFNAQVMRPFKELLKERHPNGIRLVYHVARQLAVFKEDPDFTCRPLCPGWFENDGPVYLIQLLPKADRSSS
jgi:hypothetical protein